MVKRGRCGYTEGTLTHTCVAGVVHQSSSWKTKRFRRLFLVWEENDRQKYKGQTRCSAGRNIHYTSEKTSVFSNTLVEIDMNRSYMSALYHLVWCDWFNWELYLLRPPLKSSCGALTAADRGCTRRSRLFEDSLYSLSHLSSVAFRPFGNKRNGFPRVHINGTGTVWFNRSKRPVEERLLQAE